MTLRNDTSVEVEYQSSSLEGQTPARTVTAPPVLKAGRIMVPAAGFEGDYRQGDVFATCGASSLVALPLRADQGARGRVTASGQPEQA